MSKINYQALRQAAQNAKNLGGIKNYKRGEQAVAEFKSLITPHIVLEGKDKLIAELGKQCAEWERKALSNFEECAAMAERIEEMSKQSCEELQEYLDAGWFSHPDDLLKDVADPESEPEEKQRKKPGRKPKAAADEPDNEG